jgi:hypothetical protein
LSIYLTIRYQKLIVTSKNSCFNYFFKGGKIKCVVHQGCILGPLLFLFYINDLTKIIGNNSKSVFWSSGTSYIVTRSNHIDFNKEIAFMFIQLNSWFAANLLSLNLKIRKYMQFMTKTILWLKYPLATLILIFQTLWNQSFLH